MVMKKLVISKHFETAYLTCGASSDNYVFENCSYSFLLQAKKLLSTSYNNVKPCNVGINCNEQNALLKTLEHCPDELRKKLLVRDFVCAKIMLSMIEDLPNKKDEVITLKNGINAILENNWHDAVKFHEVCPMPHDITKTARALGKIELNMFLMDIDDKLIQQAVNNFISSREPYSVKVFTTRQRLACYYDQVGNIIQCPHDFMQRDVRDYVEMVETDCQR